MEYRYNKSKGTVKVRKASDAVSGRPAATARFKRTKHLSGVKPTKGSKKIRRY